MKVKVFQPNSHGKIEFTRAELEKLLNEVYDAGFRDGEAAQREKSTWTWTSPYRYNDSITLTNGTNCTNTIDNHTQPIDKLTCTYDSVTNINDTSIAKNTTIDVAPVSITMKQLNEEDRKRVGEELTKLLNANRALRAHEVNDVFSNLAKELNF
jgi:hypothetical protein